MHLAGLVEITTEVLQSWLQAEKWSLWWLSTTLNFVCFAGAITRSAITANHPSGGRHTHSYYTARSRSDTRSPPSSTPANWSSSNARARRCSGLPK
jgi:hypothetical protein